MLKIMKSKLGFTLVELMVVILILGVLVAIAVPIYSSINEKSRVKVCGALQQEIYTNAKNYCIDNNYNENFTFKIRSDVEAEKGVLLNAEGTEFTEKSDIDLLTNEVLKGDVPYCPSGGTYTITVTKVVGGIAKIEVTCDGSDGTHQKD